MNIQYLPRETVRLPDGMPPEPIFRLTVNEYHDMLSSGVFDDNSPIELLEGYLVSKMGEGPKHHLLLEALRRIIERQLPPGTDIRTDGPISLSTSEPEPDLAVIRGSYRDYGERHPSATDTFFVVEVADSSAAKDFGWKKRIYAAEGPSAYCIVDVSARQIVVHSQLDRSKTPAVFASVVEFGPGQTAIVEVEQVKILINHTELFEG